MSKTIEQLRDLATQIEEATRQGENTQLRVGGLFNDIIDFIAQIPVTETTLGPLLQALNNSGLINPNDGQTLTFSIMDDNWTFSDGLTQLQLAVGEINELVTSNYEAWIRDRGILEDSIARTEDRVRNNETRYNNDQLEYHNWKRSTDSYVSQFITAFTVDGRMVSMTEVTQTAFDIMQTVSSNKAASDAAFDNINNNVIPGIRNDLNAVDVKASGSATWIYQNGQQVLVAASAFDANGRLISTSGLVTEANYASMFTEAMNANGVVVRADISTFITLDEAGQLISVAKISADQIVLTSDFLNAVARAINIDTDHLTIKAGFYDLVSKNVSITTDQITIKAGFWDLVGENVNIDFDQVNMTAQDWNLCVAKWRINAQYISLQADTFLAWMKTCFLNADNLVFQFNNAFSVLNKHADEVMWLSETGDLHIGGSFYYDRVKKMISWGGNYSNKMYITDSVSNGARLLGKKGDITVIDLGFTESNIGTTENYGVLKLGYGSYMSELHSYYLKISTSYATSTLWSDSLEINYGGHFKFGTRNRTSGVNFIVISAPSRAYWPTVNDALVGEVYLDGDTLKVKG